MTPPPIPEQSAIPTVITHGFLVVGSDAVDIGALRIITRDPAQRLTPKALAVLLELARHQGETISRDHLLDRVWTDTSPTPDVVKQSIMELRKAFESDVSQPVIETISKMGYRLLVPVSFTAVWPISENVRHEGASPVHLHHDVQKLLSAEDQDKKTDAVPARKNWLSYALVAVLAGIGLAALLNRTPEESTVTPAGGELAAAPVIEYSLLTSDLGPESFPVISPDGKLVAYSVQNEVTGATRVKLQSADGSSARWLNQEFTQNEKYPVWSSDSSVLAYQQTMENGDCIIVSKSILGGASRKMSDCWRSVLQYFDWSFDGKELAFSELKSPSHNPGGTVSVLDLATDKSSYMPYPPTEGAPDYEPKFSANARQIIFRRGIQPNNDLFLYDRENRKLRKLTDFGKSIKGYTWTPNDKGVIFSSNHQGDYALFFIDLSSNVISPLGIRDAILPSASKKSDKLVFAKLRIKRTLGSVSLLKRDSQMGSALPPSTASETDGAISNLGNKIAFISSRSGQQQVWVKTPSDLMPMQVSNFDQLGLSNLQWSPDDKSITVIAGNGKHSRLYRIEIEKKKVVPLTSEDFYLVQASNAQADGGFWLIGHSNGNVWKIWRGKPDKDKVVFLETPLSGEYIQQDVQTGKIVVLETQRGKVSLFDENLKFLSILDIGSVMSLRVRSGAVWYFSLKSSGAALSKISLSDGKAPVILREGLPFDWSYRNFDVAPDGSFALLNTLERDDTDIAIASLPSSMTR